MDIYNYDYDAARIAYSLKIEEQLERDNDSEYERRQEILEALENDELIEEAFDAFSELFNGESEQRATKMVNKLVKAMVLKIGLDKPISSLFCDLTIGDEDIISSYLLK